MLDLQNRSIPQAHPRFTNQAEYFHIQGNQIKKMLQNINKILGHFLDDLEKIYEANGLNFSISHFHYALIRLLTPFQLLSHFNLVDNSQMFLSIKDLQKRKFHEAMSNSQRNQFKSQFSGYQNSKNENKKQEFKLIPNRDDHKMEDLTQSYQQKPNKPKKFVKCPEKANKKHFYRRERSKPILSSQVQCELVDWVFRKFQENKRIRRKDIALKALKLSGNVQGFEGSVGWVNRFLGRHPNLKQVVTRRAKNNLGKKPEACFSDQDEQQIDKLHANDIAYNDEDSNQEEQEENENIKLKNQQQHENQAQNPYYNSIDEDNQGQQSENLNNQILHMSQDIHEEQVLMNEQQILLSQYLKKNDKKGNFKPNGDDSRYFITQRQSKRFEKHQKGPRYRNENI